MVCLYYIAVCFLFPDYMVGKLKEDGLDNVHTEDAKVHERLMIFAL